MTGAMKTQQTFQNMEGLYPIMNLRSSLKRLTPYTQWSATNSKIAMRSTPTPPPKVSIREKIYWPSWNQKNISLVNMLDNGYPHHKSMYNERSLESDDENA